MAKERKNSSSSSDSGRAREGSRGDRANEQAIDNDVASRTMEGEHSVSEDDVKEAFEGRGEGRSDSQGDDRRSDSQRAERRSDESRADRSEGRSQDVET